MDVPCGGGVGTGPLGGSPFGTGYALAIDFARAVATNAVDVTFIGIPDTRNAASAESALAVSNWSISVREPHGAVLRLIQSAEKISSNVVRLLFDGVLEPEAIYRVQAIGVESVTGLPIDPLCDSADFFAFGRTRVVRPVGLREQEERSDIANPFLPKDAPNRDADLGTYQLSDTRDLARDSGVSNFRKRILRRTTTAMGGFFHLPNYGSAKGLKTRITPDVLRDMQATTQEQILREPDAVSVIVTATQAEESPFVVILSIRATQRDGTVLELDAPIDLEP